MRREWIEEEKPRLFQDSGATREELENARDLQTSANPREMLPSNAPHQEGSPEDLFIPDSENARPTTSHPEPEEDDLDDLLREEEPMPDSRPKISISSRGPDLEKDFDADYEAMNELGM